MYITEIHIDNFRLFGTDSESLTLPLQAGLTALVGENDSGKTAVVDAVRLALGTRDNDAYRLDDEDFHLNGSVNSRAERLRVRLKFVELSQADVGAFAEYLTYETVESGTVPVLYQNLMAERRPVAGGEGHQIDVKWHSGQDGTGPRIDVAARALLCCTYLRPLRDAERAMAGGRRSRLSQILLHTDDVRVGEPYDRAAGTTINGADLSLVGLADYTDALLEAHPGLQNARERLNTQYLDELTFAGEDLKGRITVAGRADDDFRLRQMLEKLELELTSSSREERGRIGLGSHNLLFMACELLLLGAGAQSAPLLIVEEPEAHLHPQRQLRLVQFLRQQAEGVNRDAPAVQVIVTTHSPTIASSVSLSQLIVMQNGKACTLAQGTTRLSASDYSFLSRFLDATKANLFFARGVLIVEGDAEQQLLPTLGYLLGRDFAAFGVSIVNVGGVGLSRYARIYQRATTPVTPAVDVRVGTITDFDVMPDCAPQILGRDSDLPKSSRHWRVRSDFTVTELETRRRDLKERTEGGKVAAFVADHWTLEYDLAMSGLSKDVWVAASLALADEQIHQGRQTESDVIAAAVNSYDQDLASLPDDERACKIFSLFDVRGASKAIAAQRLAARLKDRLETDQSINAETLRAALPAYIVEAIDYVTGAGAGARTSSQVR